MDGGEFSAGLVAAVVVVGVGGVSGLGLAASRVAFSTGLVAMALAGAITGFVAVVLAGLVVLPPTRCSCALKICKQEPHRTAPLADCSCALVMRKEVAHLGQRVTMLLIGRCLSWFLTTGQCGISVALGASAVNYSLGGLLSIAHLPRSTGIQDANYERVLVAVNRTHSSCVVTGSKSNQAA